MYELNQVAERTYYINCPTKIGIYRQTDRDVYLIDSGNNRTAGKKIWKILNENKWNLKGIINTHSHADHIGGNKYLQQQTGCKIFADGLEAAFAKNLVLEPSFLYGGYPGKDYLKHKYQLTQESDVSPISDCDFPKELEVIPLWGHFFHMTGIRTPDNVVFLADCILSAGMLEKIPFPFIYDIAESLNTLNKVETMEASLFVPAHADAVENIKELVQLNRQKIFDIADKLQTILKTPMCFDTLLKQIFDEYRLNMNFEQYVLIGSTIRSYLSWMKDSGYIEAVCDNNLLKWIAQS